MSTEAPRSNGPGALNWPATRAAIRSASSCDKPAATAITPLLSSGNVTVRISVSNGPGVGSFVMVSLTGQRLVEILPHRGEHPARDQCAQLAEAHPAHLCHL